MKGRSLHVLALLTLQQRAVMDMKYLGPRFAESPKTKPKPAFLLLITWSLESLARWDFLSQQQQKNLLATTSIQFAF